MLKALASQYEASAAFRINGNFEFGGSGRSLYFGSAAKCQKRQRNLLGTFYIIALAFKQPVRGNGDANINIAVQTATAASVSSAAEPDRAGRIDACGDLNVERLVLLNGCPAV